MRLHQLRMQAFGPFAGVATVDLDELSDAGLFLLSGATGAGKTSVLDAICFALYGEVPGDRHDAKHLRSDQADDRLAPEVSLLLSVRGRTLRFTRSPAWQRPKRRGTGATTEHARVVVEEQHDGGWRTLTTRIDDAGLLVSDLLGMTCLQFTQVAMLPQGRFQAFLRASSSERHAVLQRLFRTDRFERVERWLTEERTRLRRASERAGAEVTALVHRTQEVARCPVPEEWDLADLGAQAADHSLSTWADQQVAELVARADTADAEAAAARARLERSRAAHAEAVRLSALLRRLATARTEASALDALADDTTALRASLEAHERAQPLAGLVERSAAAEHALDEAGHAARRALASPALSGITTLDDAQLQRTRSISRAAELEALKPLLDDVAAARAEQLQARAGVDRASCDLETLLVADEGRAERITELEARCARAAAASAALEGLRARHAHVHAGLAAREQSIALSGRLGDARTALASATTRAQELREAYQDAREARITAMAGELAGVLASGCACPVCGSTSHPRLAVTSSTHGREHEEQARRDYEDADVARAVAADELAALEVSLHGAEVIAGELDLPGWLGAVRDADDALAAAQRAATQAAALAAELSEARQSRTLDEARAGTLRAELAGLEARAQAAAGRAGVGSVRLREALAPFLDDGAHDEAAADDDLTSLLERALADARRACAVAETAVRALARRDQLAAAARELREAATSSAAAGGFADTEAVLDALLDDAALARVRSILDDRERRAHAAQAVLADEEVRAAADGPAPDLAAAQQEADAAEASGREAESTRAAAVRDRDRVADLVAHLDSALRRWTPVREQHRIVAELAAFAEGKSADNVLRMRLSAYVLSERLRQVVAAANERLTRMTEARYTLQHTDERGVGAQRGGLSLMVRDEWSGVERDPATLSGGETFVVSLALALGLADTVAHEAGGTDIDTLFIDEGFGSLDADTLDDVLDTLDSLREGGRVVGVVSHVGEMRERIPARLEVRKSPRGSTLAGVGSR